MTYNTEDEIDWSDSPLGPPSPQAVEPSEGSHYLSPATDFKISEQSASDTRDGCAVAHGLPLPPSTHIGTR
jgi:hypothetical protein